MRLFFLGTGSAEGMPALFCACSVCAEAKKRGGADCRTRATVLLDGTVKIDLPPDTLAHVQRYPQLDFAHLSHLLFTHSHDDHFAVRELQYLSPNFAPNRREPLHVWATHELIKKMLPEMAHFFEEAPLRFHPVRPFVEVAVAHLFVTPVTAHHKQDELCLNYLVRDPVKDTTLLYACDTGVYDLPTWKFLEGLYIDTVVLECGKGASNNGYTGHLNIEECLSVRERLLACGSVTLETPFYLTHICHTGLLLHREMEERLAPHGVRIAYDGLEIEI